MKARGTGFRATRLRPWQAWPCLSPPLARAQLVVQAIDAPFDEVAAPLAHSGVGRRKARCHRGIRFTSRTRQHELRAQRQCRWQRSRPGHGSQLLVFFDCKHHLGLCSRRRCRAGRRYTFLSREHLFRQRQRIELHVFRMRLNLILKLGTPPFNRRWERGQVVNGVRPA